MNRATYNAIRLKAYYWEKQILRGRDDDVAVQKFKKYSDELETAKNTLEEEAQKKRAERQEKAAQKLLEWRKNIRRKPSATKGYDAWTLASIEKSLGDWNPSLTVSFD